MAGCPMWTSLPENILLWRLIELGEWWNISSKIPYNDKNFQKIIDFYLFRCPVATDGKKDKKPIKKNVSKRAVTFEDKHWKGNQLTALLRIMKKDIVFEEVSSSDKVKSSSEKIEQESNQSDPYFEMVVYYPTIGNTKSVFYSIRNAFAHGSFSVVNTQKNTVYCLETEKDGKLRARIRLKEKTLLHWIELFENGSRGLETYKTKKRKTKVKI